VFALLVRCLAGGNDADGVVFDFDMHHKEQTTLLVVTDHGISRFIVAIGVNQAKERIEKHRHRLFEANSANLCIGIVNTTIQLHFRAGSRKLGQTRMALTQTQNG